MRTVYGAELRKHFAINIMLFMLLGMGALAGSVYLTRVWSAEGAGITGYLSDVYTREGGGGMALFRNLFITNLIPLAIIFVMGFLRFGPLITCAIIIRKGFITGFTAASFVSAYGAGGLLAMLAASPSLIITAPALMIFSYASVSNSLNTDKFQKKFIFSYIFFTFFIISIFCVASFFEGLLTTTFMKWVLPKIL